MKLSAKTRYAVRILFELALTDKAVSMPLLSEKTGITLRTVESICAVLRNNNISSSRIGAGGGVLLQADIASISLGQLVQLFDGGVGLFVCCGDKGNDCPMQSTCATRAVWSKISLKMQNELNAIALGDIFFAYSKGQDVFGIRK